ncbi:MAG: protein kinase domain-containing protein [Thermoanaerobaculia bacterium]
MKLGRYEIVRELGKGAMGIVYLAKDPLIGRLVALKTIRPAAHADDDETKEFQQRFIREAQAAGILNHPSIVTVFDIGQDPESSVNFIAMEFVEGHNLKEILAQGRTLSFDEIGEIIAQVADALDFAHSKGIVHRDVKPANVILLEGNRAKIMDFGIAKIASGGGNLTTTGQFLGTPNYMAPEQIKGAAVDGRTDLFALGICFYECLTRRKPFGGDSLTSISYKIVHEPFPPLHEINPQIPDGYEEIVAMCLAKDPGKRYQRGRELANALRAVIRGEKPSARTEPMLAEDTIVTRDGERIPTVDMPFPDAAMQALAAAHSVQTKAVPSPRPPAGRGAAASAANAGVPKRTHPLPPVIDKLSETMRRVRTSPKWHSRIHPAVFVAIVGVLIAALGGAVISLNRQKPKITPVDTIAEARRAKERQLRQEANELLAKGNVQDAYKKFEELSRLAPTSPAVMDKIQKLSAIRRQEEIGKQQLQLAQQKRDQGAALIGQGKFSEAIASLSESFSLNPGDDLTVNFLKIAQQEQQRVDFARAEALRKAGQKPGAVLAGGSTRAPVPASTLANLTTVFKGSFNDGYIMVRVGADVVLHEYIFEERGRFLAKRKYPRPIEITKQLTPKNADVQILVTVPSQKINAQHVIRHNFAPGSSQQLVISYNPQSKTFNYQLN